LLKAARVVHANSLEALKTALRNQRQ
jgi:hypothetical protein